MLQKGAEHQAVLAIMTKLLAATDPAIVSAYTVPALPNRIVVEGRDPRAVWRACSEVSLLQVGRQIVPVPVEERTDLLKIHSQNRRPLPFSWVRLRRGLYKGDLALVVWSSPTSDIVRLLLVPRILLCHSAYAETRKRKRISFSERPPAKLFNRREVVAVYGEDSVQFKNYDVFQNQGFTSLGLLQTRLFSTLMIRPEPNPTLVEVRPFVDACEVKFEDALAVTSHEVNARLKPGNSVMIISGEHRDCKGIVVDIENGLLFIDIDEDDCYGNMAPKIEVLLQVPLAAVRRLFCVGDYVRVMAGADGLPGPAGHIVEVEDPLGRLCLVDEQTKELVCLDHIATNVY
jgi:transcription elongation factor SPT5